MSKKFRITSILSFAILAVISSFLLTRIQFTFDFEQFFPQGDPDLEYFKKFIKEFEGDDNFLLIAIEREEGVFEQEFLEKFHDLSIKAKGLPQVMESQSLTKIAYPIKTPFGFTTIPAIHLDQPERYARDRERIMADPRFPYNFISPDGKALLILLKTEPAIQLAESQDLMRAVDELISTYDFEDHHYLGRAYFQKELVAMQKREIIVSASVAAALVFLIMMFIFRRPIGISIALLSVGVGMLLFVGFLGATGRPLNAMAALYPVLMIIVGTSDVIHIMSKYIDELRKGQTRRNAIRVTIREIGLATLLTSLTTAIGFASLMTSRIQPIRDFGLNAAVGVVIAYITVIFFSTALLSMFRTDQIIKLGKAQAFWERSMEWLYHFTRDRWRRIAWGGLGLLLVCLLGISWIQTNYQIIRNLPNGKKITEDFKYFEENFTGFRPFELTATAGGTYRADDYEVLLEIEKLENRMQEEDGLRGINSITALYKSLNQMHNNNRPEAYRMPDSKARFMRYKRLAEDIPQINTNVLLSKDGKKARISSRVLDIGATNIKKIGTNLDDWVESEIDASVVTFRQTGTGLIIDKNSEYVRRSLMYGLGSAILIVSLLMAFLFRNWKMLIISLIPNIFPLLIAGALLGFLGIDLEAGISIVFAVIFGIAVDDTIHFLSKFKLAQNKGMDIEEALQITFLETGKAITLTTIILFFGFLVMLFSIHPPSVTIGLLISITLVSALFSDFLFIPLLIRKLL